MNSHAYKIQIEYADGEIEIYYRSEPLPQNKIDTFYALGAKNVVVTKKVLGVQEPEVND